jgi:hypothetical protein
VNLFTTSADPAECARHLDDKRVVNQCRETAQMLCTAIRAQGLHDPSLMRTAHPHHPVTLWVGRGLGNWSWTFEHFDALGREKLVRFPGNPAHRNWLELREVLTDLARMCLPDRPLEPFVNCTRREDKGIDFTWMGDTLEAYRLYLAARWRTDASAPRFTNRHAPLFYPAPGGRAA